MVSVDALTQNHLLALNRQFYQTFGEAFAEKRGRLQPGVVRLLPRIPPQARVLDLGCGHGMVLRALARRGFRGEYVGVDFSAPLLAQARANAPADLRSRFVQADLTDPSWTSKVGAGPFEVVLALAVFHHLPGQALRQRVLTQAAALLRPGGALMLSVWAFLHSPRLRQRVQPWERVGLTVSQVDPGDYLLDWRHGGQGFRYVHHFTSVELEALLRNAGLHIEEMFLSDGENGRLGLYAVGRRPLPRE